jgi:hypothetical protein
MSGTNQAGLQMVQSRTTNGSMPSVQRTYEFQLNLATGIQQTFDLRMLQGINVFKDAQGAFIDNSANSTAFSFSLASGQTVICPPNSQGFTPLYIPVGTPVLTCGGNGIVTITLINVPTPAAFWSVSGSALPVSGGFVQVQDNTVAGLIAAPEGSMSGGLAGTLSFAAGGIYQTAVPTLTNGQQAALQFTQQGALKTASGGQSSLIGATASAVVKAAPGRIGKITITGSTSPTATIVVTDTTTVVTPTAANTIFVIGANVPLGTIYNLDFPCQNGIVINFVAGTGTLVISFD